MYFENYYKKNQLEMISLKKSRIPLLPSMLMRDLTSQFQIIFTSPLNCQPPKASESQSSIVLGIHKDNPKILQITCHPSFTKEQWRKIWSMTSLFSWHKLQIEGIKPTLEIFSEVYLEYSNFYKPPSGGKSLPFWGFCSYKC